MTKFELARAIVHQLMLVLDGVFIVLAYRAERWWLLALCVALAAISIHADTWLRINLSKRASPPQPRPPQHMQAA